MDRGYPLMPTLTSTLARTALTRTFLMLVMAIVVLAINATSRARAQSVDWRFGFEYIEIEPPFASEAEHDTLLSRLASVTAQQRKKGAINVNSIGGGWNGMQPTATSAINFTQTDAWVKRLQDGGFELVWNFENNAPWSFVDNPGCIDGPFNDECAPDSAHESHWFNFVKAIVERYDGDGTADMPGLRIPVRFYVMHQEIYFSGQGKGDRGEELGEGYWDDNVTNLLRLHRLTWRAIREADPTGNTKLVASGGWFIDLYGDFPDYPALAGPTVRARLNGDNPKRAIYSKGYDSLVALVRGLGDDTGGPACDYIGWHPHSGWKASDQSMKFIRTHAPNKPIFIDDMWSTMLTDTLPNDGYLQFLSGLANERDFPSASVPSYRALIAGLNAGDSTALRYYNAKGARDAVKCFATIFGEGAERACYSLSNDFNPNHPIYLFSGPWRFTGLVGNRLTNYAPKPATHTMRMLVGKLHDFTAVQRVELTGNPYTRCYRFDRERGTPCWVLWSEAVASPADPAAPNGELISLPVSTDSVLVTGVIEAPGATVAPVQTVAAPGRTFSAQLGFSPIIVEEVPGSSGVEEGTDPMMLSVSAPPGHIVVRYTMRGPAGVDIALYDLAGRRVATLAHGTQDAGLQSVDHATAGIPRGTYLLRARAGALSAAKLIVIGR